jgi:F420-dependent methylenetetrahydromethanopterin dehydrogenase
MEITTRKSNALRNSERAYSIAQKIADAACELDFLKKVADQAVASAAEKHINILHRCAAELAGDRACEIYEQVNELKVDLRYKRSR